MPYYKTIIVVVRGVNKALAAKHGCSEQYVGRCLRYEAHSELADNIRKDAIKNYHGKRVNLEL